MTTSKSNHCHGDPMRSLKAIEPRFQETDLMGIIHHSVYPVWYELGRIQFCIDAGMPYESIIQRNVHLALTDVGVHYHQPARFGDRLIVETRLTELSKVKMRFDYRIINQDDVLINTGHTTLVWLNAQLKPTNIAKLHPDIHACFETVIDNK